MSIHEVEYCSTTNLMQTRLPIEENNIAVNEMTFYDISDAKTIRYGSFVSKLQIFLKAVTTSGHVVCPGVHIATLAHSSPQGIDIVGRNPFGICEYLANALRYGDFVDAEIGVWRDDCSPGEIYALS